MKREIYYCDICKQEINTPRLAENIQVTFTTEQNEGRATTPYLGIVKIDICDGCKTEIIQGSHVFATGAMGYNKYSFAHPK